MLPFPLLQKSATVVQLPTHDVRLIEGETVKAVKEPEEPGESGESLTSVSPEDRDAVILAVSALMSEGKPLSREAIKQHLGWNNKKHWVVKTVCDEYNLCKR